MLPAKLQQNNTSLLLNGGGIRTKYFFKVYVGGLYLTTKTDNASDIISSDRPMAIRMVVTSSLISSDIMVAATKEGFKKSLKGKTAPFQNNIDDLIETFSKEPIKEGDVYDFWYFPKVGIKSYKNGKLENTISGYDFKKAFFGIWLSDDPVDEDLKKGLLGK